eukprot:6683357-Ditylum_brightwellii.AAC.1
MSDSSAAQVYIPKNLNGYSSAVSEQKGTLSRAGPCCWHQLVSSQAFECAVPTIKGMRSAPEKNGTESQEAIRGER